MSNQPASYLIASLKQMIQYCKDIQELMNTDQADFSKNNIARIHESNVNKALLLGKLTDLTNDINGLLSPHQSSNSVIETIEKHTEKFEPATKREIEAVMAEFKNELAKSYQCLVTNNKIISINIQHIQSIWEKIYSIRSETEFVYDNKGGAGK